MGIRSFLLLVTAAMVVLLVLGVWFYPTNSDFRADNSLWNGLQDITSDYHGQTLDSLADLSSLPPGATLIVIPYLDFNTMEIEQLYRFTSRGGRLILADDYGYGNRVLEYLGLSPRFAGGDLLDPLVNYKNKQFPRITRLQPDVLTNHTDNLVFNHATGLANIAEAEVLAMSSPFSFLDANGNGTHEDNEPSGPLTVISRQPLGDGQVILISDPSIFINGMDIFEGNATLIKNIAASTDMLYIDQSHLAQSDLGRTRNWLEKARRLVSTPAGTAGLVIIGITASLIPVWHRKKEEIP